jgi:hypothetical protein
MSGSLVSSIFALIASGLPVKKGYNPRNFSDTSDPSGTAFCLLTGFCPDGTRAPEKVRKRFQRFKMFKKFERLASKLALLS